MEMESGKLFIGGISWDTSEERLREYFQTFGDIVEAVIMRDRTTGRARGFGFIVFADASVAEKVVWDRHVIDGRTVEAKKAVPRDDHQNFNRNTGSVQGSPGPTRTKKIFVGGLASTVTEADFKQYFDQFGTITDVVVMYDHNTQRPRGFGFITYDSEEAVDKVLFKTFHELNGKMVEVKWAIPKELSPGPTRSPLVGGNGFNNGLNRVNSSLNAYTHGFNPYSPGGYGMRMEGRFSPVTVPRSEYPPYSLSSYSNMGLNLESGFNLNYGPAGDSVLTNRRWMNSSYYSGNTPNRFGGPAGYETGPTGNRSLTNNVNRNLWGSVNFDNYNSNNVGSNAFASSVTGNTGPVSSFGNIGDIWGSTPVSGQGVSLGIGSVSYGGMEDNDFGFRIRAEYGMKNGDMTSSYAIEKSIREEGLGSLSRNESFGERGWNSSSAELRGLGSFVRGVNEDVILNNSVGYVGDYCVNARTNRGIAA